MFGSNDDDDEQKSTRPNEKNKIMFYKRFEPISELV